jgi:broad specificity phosphatase PhoE
MSADPGKSLEQLFAEKKYPVLAHRNEKFPMGESLDDLGKRAEKAIRELVMPHVWKAAREGRKGVQLAVVSHGLCISEVLIHVLLYFLTFTVHMTNSLYRHCSRRVSRTGQLWITEACRIRPGRGLQLTPR